MYWCYRAVSTLIRHDMPQKSNGRGWSIQRFIMTSCDGSQTICSGVYQAMSRYAGTESGIYS